MATKSAGRVSIRVLPDSTRFKKDLETSLRRIERQLHAKIQAELVLSRESLAKLKRQIESLVVKIRPTIELNISEADIAELKAKIEATKPVVDVKLNTVEASRRVASLTRTRNLFIDIHLRGIKSLASKLGAMSGFNVLLDTFRAGGDFINNLDRNAVKIARMATIVSGALAGVVGLIGGVGVIGNDLAKLGNISILGPAFISGFAIGIATLIVSLKDMKTVLADLGPLFTDLQNKMSKKFWDQAEKPIRSLVKNLFPTLKKQLQDTASHMGTLFGEVAASIERNATPEIVTRMFDRMHKAMEISRRAINPLTHAFVTLGDHGSKYFERFSLWIVDLSTRFDNFLSAAALDGRLDKWTNDAIEGFKDLGRALAGMTDIFGSIGRAARNAGYGGLNEFADSMQNIGRIMNGERFQRGMSGIFAAILPTLDGIKRGFIRLGPAIESALPTFTRVMGTFGSIFEKAFGFVATFLENPTLQKGVVDFVDGINNAMKKLEPAMDPLATSLGGVLTLMGDVLERVAGLVADMAVKLGPEFDKILAAITPLLDPLSKLAASLIDNIKPVLKSLAEDILPPLVTALGNVFPWIDKIVGIISPVAVLLMQNMGAAMRDFLGWAKIDQADADRVLNFMERIGDNLSKQKFTVPDLGGGRTPGGLGQQLAFKFAIALGQESPLAVEYFKWLDKNITAIKNGAKTLTFIQDVMDTLTDPVKLAAAIATAVANITLFFKNLETSLKVAFKIAEISIKRLFQKTFKDIFGFGASGDPLEEAQIGGSVQGAKGMGVSGKIEKAWGFDDASMSTWGIEIGKKFATLAGNVWSGFLEGLKSNQDVKNFIQGFELFIVAVKTLFGIHSPSTVMFAIAGDVVQGFIDGLTGIGERVRQKWEEVKTWITTKCTEIKANLDLWWADVKLNWDNFWNGLGLKVQETWQFFLDWIEIKKTEIKTAIDTWITEVRTNWDNFWNGLGVKVQETWQFFLDWINIKKTEIKTSIDTWITEVKTNWETFWNGVGSFLQVKWDEMVLWVRTKADEIKTNITQFGLDVKTNWDNFWNGVNSKLEEIWNTMVKFIETKVNEAVEWVKSLPGKAKEALDLGVGSLASSGASLISGFIGGMGSMLEAAKRKAAEIVQAVKDFFPSSPAKVGPFSGTGYTPYSGRALVKDFADGMMSNMSKVREATKAVAEAAHLGSQVDLTTDLDQDGVVIDRREVNLTINHPIAEPSSRTIERASNTLRMAKAL